MLIFWALAPKKDVVGGENVSEKITQFHVHNYIVFEQFYWHLSSLHKFDTNFFVLYHTKLESIDENQARNQENLFKSIIANSYDFY